MKIDLPDDTIKGMALVSVILSFILDMITIENHHMLLFEKNEDLPQSPQQILPIENNRVIQPVVISSPQEIEEVLGDNDDEKSFLVDDIQSIQSEHFDNISRTENIYHEMNNEYTDNGIPIEKYSELADTSNKEINRHLQPHPQTTVKNKAIRSIKF